MHWIEREARAAQAECGGVVDEGRILAAMERGGILLVWADVPEAWCTHTERGPVVTLPRTLLGLRLLRCLAHEWGHGRCTVGLAGYLWSTGCPRLQRLSRICGWKEEHEAREFERHLLEADL